jgi:hypothetical protein
MNIPEALRRYKDLYPNGTKPKSPLDKGGFRKPTRPLRLPTHANGTAEQRSRLNEDYLALIPNEITEYDYISALRTWLEATEPDTIPTDSRCLSVPQMAAIVKSFADAIADKMNEACRSSDDQWPPFGYPQSVNGLDHIKEDAFHQD